MAQRKMNYLFPAVAALLLLAAPLAMARKYVGVNQWCTTADHRRICTIMVRNASSWHDAALNAILYSLRVAKRLQGLTNEIEAGMTFLDESEKKQIMETCQQDFDRSVEDIELSLKYLENNDTGTIQLRIGANLQSDCAQICKESGVEFPLAQMREYLRKLLNNVLAIVLQI